MAARKMPARAKSGRFKKGPARRKPATRKRRTSTTKRKPTTTRKRRTSGGTTVVVRSNPPRKAPAKRRRKRRNPPTPPWLGAAGVAAAVAATVQLIRAYAPIAALKTPEGGVSMLSAMLGPAAALIGSAMLMRKPKTRPMSYALLGAWVYSLASYATAYAAVKVQETIKKPNPPRRGRRTRKIPYRGTNGVPADQRARLAQGVTSLPLTTQVEEYSM
jgi:hypothetical protein